MSPSPPPLRPPRPGASVFALLALVAAGCSGEAPGPAPRDGTAPRTAPTEPAPEPPLVVESPRVPVRGPYTEEALATSVLFEVERFADRLFVRDFEAAATLLHADFRGHDPCPPAGDGQADWSPLPLGARRRAVVPGAVLDAEAWMASLAARLGPWRRLQESHWRVGRTEFAQDDPVLWGRVELLTHVVGVTDDGGRASLGRRAWARVEREAGGAPWRVREYELVEGRDLRRDGPGLVEVTRATGLALEGPRFGEPGNDRDGWNGAALGDVDGDGRTDLFVPGPERNRLYVATADGRFRECAEERGVDLPAGGTGALFLDVDNDGDADLAVAHVGWVDSLGEHGEPLHVYENDGTGSFEDVSEALGLDQRMPAFSLTAFDADGDGWLDLFACGYGRMEYATNDNWVEATNGASDLLLRNDRGRGFVDVTEAAGLEDSSWTYAAAVADVDGDGDLDLYAANNFGSNRLYRNRGDGTFERAEEELGLVRRGITMGARFADLDADGLLDLYVTGPSSATGRRIFDRFSGEEGEVLRTLSGLHAGNGLFRALPGGGFESVEDAGGAGHAGWAWGSVAVDLDLDGLLDLCCVNGFVTGELPTDT